MHATVHRFVEKQSGQARPGDHSRIGRWYEEALKADNRVASVEEAVYHLVAAGEADSAAQPAVDLARRYRENLRYADAGRLLESVISLSPGNDMLESLLEARGYLHNYLGRYDHAVQDFQAMIKSARERESSSIQESKGLHGLANTLDRLGRYKEAVEAYKKALEIDKQAYGTEAHPEYAVSLAGLASALSRLCRYKEAVEAYNNSLEIDKQAYGTEAHPSYAISLQGLANALYSLGRYEEAVGFYIKALEIQKQAYGSDEHPDSLQTRSNLGMTLAEMGRIDQALREMDRALAIARIMGHPFQIGNTLFLYAHVESARDAEKAMEMASEAETLLLRVFEPSHPTVRGVRALIAKLEGGADPGRESQRPEVSADMLKGWTQGLLDGVPSVSKEAFIHLVQRIILMLTTKGLLTQLAVGMGRPGLELEDPAALDDTGRDAG